MLVMYLSVAANAPLARRDAGQIKRAGDLVRLRLICLDESCGQELL